MTLTTGARLVVEETPDEVAAAVREWHVAIAAGAMTNVHGPAALLVGADH